MRYIDIDQLDIPPGWQDRADLALNELRLEIQKAENEARAAGKSPEEISEARKAATTAGLNLAARQRIWRDLAGPLGALSWSKCWYSESRNPTADKDVDHFRPKNRVHEEPNHEGYWWRAFDPQNLRYSSQWCNQRRIDKIHQTNGGKSDHFPLCTKSFRAKTEVDDCDLEEPLLLDPIDPDDWKLLTFRSNGEPTPAAASGTLEHDRAKITILVYHLHCRELVNERRPLAVQIERLVKEIESLMPRLTDLVIRKQFKTREKELLRLIRRDSEYSAAAMAYARGQVQHLKQGQMEKRQWLEDILNSNA